MRIPPQTSSLLRLVYAAFLVFFCLSFVPCFAVGSSDCCSEEQESHPSICVGGTTCHCACALAGVPLVIPQSSLPIQLESVSIDAAVHPVILLTRGLDRPPRFS